MHYVSKDYDQKIALLIQMTWQNLSEHDQIIIKINGYYI
jgi:hypothetical protein